MRAVEATDRHAGRRPIAGWRVLVVEWDHRGTLIASGFALKGELEEFRYHLSQLAGQGKD